MEDRGWPSLSCCLIVRVPHPCCILRERVGSLTSLTPFPARLALQSLTYVCSKYAHCCILIVRTEEIHARHRSPHR
jgi:hypothetical protein